MRRRRARGARRRVGPLGPVANGHLAGGQVDDGGRNEKRRDLARAALEERAVLALDRGEPADAGRDEDACARRFLRRDGQPRIVDGALRCGNRVLDEDVHLLDVFFLDERQGIEILDLAGDASGKLAGKLMQIELGDGPHAALAGEERVPVVLRPDAKRRHQADPRDDDSASIRHLLL